MVFSRNWAICAVLVCCLVLFARAAECKTVFVSQVGGSNANDGLSWGTAKATVMAGVSAALAGDEVWVAKGTYVEFVRFASSVALYGGFAGNETAREQRNWRTNVTVLDGNNRGVAVSAAFNDYYPTIRIDGFTVQHSRDSAIGCYGCVAIITNNTIVGNSSSYSGGGIYCYSCTPTITNNTITGNSASSNGGGIYCYSSTPVISNNVIRGNSAGGNGGGVYCEYCGTPTITGNTISGNGATDGGGVYSINSSTTTLSNNLVAFNSSGIYCANNTNALRNNDVYGNPAYNYLGVSAGALDISADPMLVAVRDSFHIQPDSPCRNAGWNGAPAVPATDIDGQPRIQDETVDIGADESDGTLWTVTPVVVRVDGTSGNDSNDGSNWSLAKKTIQASIDSASTVSGEVWVKAGTYSERIALQPFTPVYGGFDGTETGRSQRDWTRNRVIIDGGNGGPVVTALVVARGSRIDGFTIRNGNSADGGGIYCHCSSLTIANSIISGNWSQYGGAIYCDSSFATIENNAIADNWAYYGGAIYCLSSSPTVTNNNISRNTAEYRGGGICCLSSILEITGNTITENSADFDCGGGIFCSSSSPTITNNTISGNKVSRRDSQGGAIYLYDMPSSASSPAITGNTITGNSSGSGGGIYCLLASPPITNNIIADNTGGGIYCDLSSPTISNNTLNRNSADSGGGIACNPSSAPVISGNVFNENTASRSGGAMYFNEHGSTACSTVNGNVIRGNTAASGGGIYCYYSSDIITNNTVIGNGATEGGGIYCNGSNSKLSNCIVAFNSSGIYSTGGTLALRNNDVYGNPSYNYFGLSAGAGSISSEPLFASNDYGSVHILPGSPCKNAGWNSAPGLPATDVDGQPRIQDGTVDIGADEADGTVWTVTPVVIRVDGAVGSDGNDGSNWSLAKKTVQSGIDAASAAGGEVWVRAGTYSERIMLRPYAHVFGGFAGNETDRSQRNRAVNCSMIDGGGGGSVVTALAGIACSRVDGFTIRNGNATDGGGVYCYYCSPIIANNVITGNNATFGGGVKCYYSSATITNNLIFGNSATTNGGGIYCYYLRPTITNNTIIGNSASAGGIWTYGNVAGMTISNNIVAFNSSGVFRGAWTPTMRNNDVYGNTGYNYFGLSAGTGDISSDPLFVNRTSGNYHLTASSPSINAGWNDAPGIPLQDFDGQKRIQGTTVDIGADEWWPGAADAKKAAGGSIGFSAITVSAAFPDFFYVESDDRSAGIRVDKPGHGIRAGMRVDFEGTPGTNGDGEAVVTAGPVTPNGIGSVTPVAVTNRNLGGGQFGWQGALWGWAPVKQPDDTTKPEWLPSVGLNNTGLLVKTWGRVTHSGDGFFYIDDGSGLDDGSSHQGVKVYGVVPVDSGVDPVGKRVCVTGISSCEKPGSDPVRIIRTRGADDVSLAGE